MKVSEVIKPELVKLDLKPGSKESALEALTDLLFEQGVLTDKQAFLEDVYKRESVSTTGIGNGVAIPHGKSKFVNDTSVAIGLGKDGGLEWETFDGKPVQLVVLLAVDDNAKGGEHVRLLSQMARKLASEETCRRLVQANSVDEIVSIFSED